jgi:endonuclease/exonuclease/phosphatase (EEP) superfamily protein YafD
LLRALFTYALLGVLAVTMLGQLLRDRTMLLALIMFVPVLPIVLVVIGWDVLLRGRALPIRWLSTAIALGCGALALSWQWRPALAAEPGSLESQLRIVQWNTQWGGSNRETFERILDGIDAQHPDIACLSEAPDTHALKRAWTKRHAGWSIAAAADTSNYAYAYRLALMSRYPVQKRADWALSSGHATLFEVELPTRIFRALVVDLKSSPRAPRSPSIRQAAQLVEARARSAAPVDIVLGDFNTPARFLGFDALAAAGGGYRLASLWSGHWRGTWPASVRPPFFDIDHIWVSRRWRVQSSQFFIGYSDHRGQRADLRLP